MKSFKRLMIITLILVVTLTLNVAAISSTQVGSLKKNVGGMTYEDFMLAINTSMIVPIEYDSMGESSDLEFLSGTEVDLFKAYHYTELDRIINRLAQTSVVSLELLGLSVENRSIYNMTLGTGDKTVMLIAGVHARETSNPLYLLKFTQELVNSYYTETPFYGKKASDILEEYTFQIVVCANPDGFEEVQWGSDTFAGAKSNINLVDINRNFPSHSSGILWPGKKATPLLSLKPSINYYAGQNLGSEPETQAIMRWMYKYINKSTHIYIDMHSGGSIVYDSKPEYSSVRNATSQKAGALFSKTSGYPRATDETTGEASDGTTTDYAYGISYGMFFNKALGRIQPNSLGNLGDKLQGPGYSNFAIICIETLKTGLRYSPSKVLDKSLKWHPNLNSQGNEWTRAKLPQSILAALSYR